jgi:hypothetical protein
VAGFVRTQLAKNFDSPPEVLPYSVRPGFEDCKRQLERRLVEQTLSRIGEERRAILTRKIDTLLAKNGPQAVTDFYGS